MSRLLGFEIIDQGDFYLPTSERLAEENLHLIGKESLVIPLGRTQITRPVKSLDIILRSCGSVKMLTQTKQRIFEEEKSEYTFRTLNSIVNSINNNKKLFEKIKLKLTIIDHNTDPKILQSFKEFLDKQFFKSEILKLDLETYEKDIDRTNEERKKVHNI